MTVGEAPATLEATVEPANATNKEITWSAEPQGIVSVDAQGRVTPIKAGAAQVIAKAHNGKQGVCQVTVKEVATPPAVPVERVNVTPASITLTVGEAPATLEATVEPANATNKEISWSVEPQGIVSIDAQGKVTPIKAGAAQVIAKAHNGKQGVCQVTVKEPATPPAVPVERVNVTPASITLTVGEAPTTLEATVEPANATNKDITWSVEPQGIVSVDAQGKVTPIKAGTAQVIAKAHNGKQGVCQVTVKEPATPAPQPNPSPNPGTDPNTDVTSLLAVTVSPNPFRDVITVHHTSDVRHYALFNASGAVVISGSNGAETLTISTSDLPQGTYILQLRGQAGVRSIRLVK